MSSQLDLYNTDVFKELWNGQTVAAQATDFLNKWKSCPFYSNGLVTDANITKTFYLLYARFANSPISGFTTEQWKLRLWNKIFDFAPTWEKRMDLQAKIRALTDAQLEQGAKLIYNSAKNPSITPTTSQMTELAYIDNQNTTNNKKSKIEAISSQWSVLRDDVSINYVNNFNDLFLKVVLPQNPIYFESEE